jgi:L-alanine-DL-glutamate epimerase-like enolase superfamily enzyme
VRDCLITGVEVIDVRFPTSRTLAVSDAMNQAPDYSAAYVVLLTDSDLTGRGMTFTIGRGTEVVVSAIEALAHLVKGRRLSDIAGDQRAFWRELTGDSHLRWIGPEKGVIHLATAALVNAVWDLWAQKQLMQADGVGVCQIDACRLGGVNEVLAVLLLAARFDIPVCPHAGGVGLSEYVQHLSLIDYIAVRADLTDRTIEFVDELHEHFTEPARIRRGRYVVPEAPGYSIEMRPESLREYAFPDGAAWRKERVA